MISLIAVACVTALALWTAFKDARAALFATIFSLPWFGLEADPGLRLTVYQIFITALWLRLILSPEPGKPVAPWGGFVAYVVYMIVRSALQIPALPEAHVEGGILRSPAFRPLAQIVYFIVTLLPVFVLTRMQLERGDIERVGRVYVVSCVVLALIGWLQLAVWYATGSNPIPIGVTLQYLDPSTRVGSGIFFLGEEQLYRMNSFGGEPKDLGRALVVAVLVLMAGALAGVVKSRTVALLGGFFIASIFMTLSTSAFALLAIGGGVMLAAAVLGTSNRAASNAAATMLYVSVTLCIGLGGVGYVLSGMVGGGATDSASVADLIRARTTERGQILEDFDQAIVEYLEDSPAATVFGLGMGNVHLYAEEYLEPEVAVYAAGTPFSGKHGIVRTISDGGLIGLGLLVFWVFATIAGATKRERRRIDAASNSSTWVLKALVVALLCLYLGNSGLAAHLYFLIGLLYRSASGLVPASSPSQHARPQMYGTGSFRR